MPNVEFTDEFAEHFGYNRDQRGVVMDISRDISNYLFREGMCNADPYPTGTLWRNADRQTFTFSWKHGDEKLIRYGYGG